MMPVNVAVSVHVVYPSIISAGAVGYVGVGVDNLQTDRTV